MRMPWLRRFWRRHRNAGLPGCALLALAPDSDLLIESGARRLRPMTACGQKQTLESSDMSSHLHSAAEDLKALSPSPLKDEALDALRDIRESKARTNASIERLEATLATLSPSPREQGVFRILPWIIGLLAIAALATGIDAIWTSEYCSRGRNSTSCTHGLKAQLEGAVAVVIGLLIATVPMRASIWKWLAAAFLAVLAYGLLIASLLN